MSYLLRGLRLAASIAICAALLSACATNPDRPPDPGSKKWYELRIQEIEAAKAAGHLTEEQYLSLKSETDATRAAHLNALRSRDYPPVGFVFGIGHIHHFH